MEKHLTINGRKILFDNEKNILEVIRSENIEFLTFCYHYVLNAVFVWLLLNL
jgi:NADH-quinone oxidoreductase subunit G